MGFAGVFIAVVKLFDDRTGRVVEIEEKRELRDEEYVREEDVEGRIHDVGRICGLVGGGYVSGFLFVADLIINEEASYRILGPEKMSHANPTPVPPTQILSSRPISQSAALDFLKAYLDRAANDPSLQPSAMITEHGPASRTTAAAPNLTLHNLKRIQAGLAGEILGRDLSLSTTAAETTQSRTPKKSKGDKTGAGDERKQEEQWEDREKWELEQGQGLGGEEDGTELLNTTTGEEIEVDEDGMPVTGVIDKEERKRRKKERRQAEKKARKQQAREAGEEEMEMSE
ncbi:conserved hypothetical protein [Talaromyces stipitatus ATCC 10500]|uniref:Uncharacterized protein n=1 Tax=Talaromyces stipitatus (strain ATCC 10500 / CBS 375.48 / QM 6759 / NRRL 1006) TaxID=441959 RepID=B8MKA3_TALSN|nr:uncharacterized protein TSTA_047090 [Talaromyces stipitatus ATCC 10500]EED15258.1 conserved hypothetical protein [Talaromyces stipitatus ATCC 10500]